MSVCGSLIVSLSPTGGIPVTLPTLLLLKGKRSTLGPRGPSLPSPTQGVSLLGLRVPRLRFCGSLPESSRPPLPVNDTRKGGCLLGTEDGIGSVSILLTTSVIGLLCTSSCSVLPEVVLAPRVATRTPEIKVPEETGYKNGHGPLDTPT